MEVDLFELSASTLQILIKGSQLVRKLVTKVIENLSVPAVIFGLDVV